MLRQLAPEADTFGRHSGASPGAEERFRLFEAVTDLVRETAGDPPLAILLDDMHWADEPSLLLLRHITLSLPTQRLLLWVNTRDGDPPEVLDRCARSPRVIDLRLRGLDELGVRRELESLTGELDVDGVVLDLAHQGDGQRHVELLLVRGHDGEPSDLGN